MKTEADLEMIIGCLDYLNAHATDPNELAAYWGMKADCEKLLYLLRMQATASALN